MNMEYMSIVVATLLSLNIMSMRSNADQDFKSKSMLFHVYKYEG
jgi:hypothetical protein